MGAAQPLRYRNKSAVSRCPPDGRVGFYRARSHQVVEVEHCLLQKPQADALAAALRQYLRAVSRAGLRRDAPAGAWCGTCMSGRNCKGREPCVPAGERRKPAPTRRNWWPCCVSAAPTDRGRGARGSIPAPATPFWGIATALFGGRTALTDVLCGRTVRLSVPSFYQVNHAQAERAVRQGAGVSPVSPVTETGGGPVLRRGHHHAGAGPAGAAHVIGGGDRAGGHPRTHGPERRGATAWRTRSSSAADAADVAAELAPAAAAARRHLRGPAPEGAGARTSSHAIAAHGTPSAWCMSPATPRTLAPGCEALCRRWATAPRRAVRGGPLPPHCAMWRR